MCSSDLRDRFFLCIRSTDEHFSEKKTLDWLKTQRPVRVLTVGSEKGQS